MKETTKTFDGKTVKFRTYDNGTHYCSFTHLSVNYDMRTNSLDALEDAVKGVLLNTVQVTIK